jgi:hypothetical protein
VKFTGRFFMVLSATIIQIGITVTLYIWNPDPTNSSVIFFVISGLWGVTDAVWLVQINGECAWFESQMILAPLAGRPNVFSCLYRHTRAHYKSLAAIAIVHFHAYFK